MEVFMKVLLIAINAKYIHSNLAVYSLRAYAGKYAQQTEIAEYTINQPMDDILSDIYKKRPDVLCLSCYLWNILYVEQLITEISKVLAEYTINQPMDDILSDIYKKRPDVLCLSCYLWNILYVEQLITEISKVLPGMQIWLGGPEVSYNAVSVMKKYPQVTGVMCGEGEETFLELMESKVLPGMQIWLGGPEVSYNAVSVMKKYPQVTGVMCGEGEETFLELMEHWMGEGKDLSMIQGIVYRKEENCIQNEVRPVMDLSKVPFVYDHIEDFQNKIIYYESSRGCPFSCSYCLSSIDKCLRFRDLELVKKELQFFIDHEVPQVKFVDRTFNCKHSHSMAIWTYLKEHDRGKTNFHFEVAADLLNEEELNLIASLRPGLIQLEIGIQSTNPETITEIRRKMNFEEVKRIVKRIQKTGNVHQHLDLIAGLEIGIQSTNPETITEIRRKMNFEEVKRIVKRIQKTGNVHQHLDLIAGLPYENYERFAQSFRDVYALHPEQLQLGFLKVLKGSYMHEKTRDYELLYQDRPPFEVLSTRWLSYDDVIRLKGVEEMVEVYYNSGQFVNTLRLLEEEFTDTFVLYENLSQLGFLKVLKGSYMHEKTRDYELLYQDRPPFEVLSTRWLSYDDVIRLKGVEEMVEVYYNSGQFVNTLRLLEEEFTDTFVLYENLSCYYEENGLHMMNHSRITRYEVLFAFIKEEHVEKDVENYRQMLILDLYLRENVKKRPEFAGEINIEKREAAAFYEKEEEEHHYLKGYEGFDKRQLRKMTHLEWINGKLILFDYRNRNILTNQASIFLVEGGDETSYNACPQQGDFV